MESVQITPLIQIRPRPGIGQTIQLKARQGVGKLRRLYMVHAQRSDVEEQVRSRKGDCNRCGACCKIVYRCPFLEENEVGYRCSIYESRATQCRYFPISQRDLTELAGSCSYYF